MLRLHKRLVRTIMSWKKNLILTLTLIQTNLYAYDGPILISLGTISSLINSCVFTSKNLCKNLVPSILLQSIFVI